MPGELTWSTGFIATPRVLGQQLRLTANLCLAREASVKRNQHHPRRQWRSNPGIKRTQKRLVGTTTTSNDTDHSSAAALHNLLSTAGELNTGRAILRVVANDGNVVAGGTAEGAPVANLLLNIGDNGTLRNGAQGQDVADSQGGVLSGVDKLSSVHSLVGNEGLGDILVPVWVAEGDFCERSTTARVVDYLLDDTSNVSMALSVVERAELSWRLVETGVGR